MTKSGVARIIITAMLVSFATIVHSEDDNFLKAYNLGIGYASAGTESSAEDLQLARYWLGRSATENYQPAVHALGWLYYKGLGVEKDLNKAFAHFETAARAGYDESQYMLGVMYGQGWGVEKDSIQSLQWMRKAAGQGHASASSVLEALHITQ